MKLTRLLRLLPLAAVLCVPISLHAKDNDGSENWARKSEQEWAKQRRKTEKSWRRSTEGHRPQDRNGDGVISRREWPGNDQSFRQLDRDRDGSLTNRDRQVTRKAPVYRDGRWRIR